MLADIIEAAGLIVPGLIFLLVSVALLLAFLRWRTHKSLRSLLDDEDVIRADARAIFFGSEVENISAIREYGSLALTRQTIVFAGITPDITHAVEIASITAIRTPLAHLGHSGGKMLLWLAYTMPDGSTDTVAWEVSHVEKWVDAIEELTGLKKQRPQMVDMQLPT